MSVGEIVDIIQYQVSISLLLVTLRVLLRDFGRASCPTSTTCHGLATGDWRFKQALIGVPIPRAEPEPIIVEVWPGKFKKSSTTSTSTSQTNQSCFIAQ